MEKRHREILREKFNDSISEKEIIVLDIADDYEYMDEDLVEMLKASVGPYL